MVVLTASHARTVATISGELQREAEAGLTLTLTFTLTLALTW